MGKKKNDHYWIGFDLGGTKMMATVFDRSFTPIGQKRRKTKAHEGMEAGMRRMVQTIQDAAEDARIPCRGIQGIGIGSPGPLDLDQGMILDTSNLGWRNAPIKKTMEKHFACTAVVMNDVDAGTYGEYQFGAGKGARTVIGIFPGTGIGGGCVYDGRVLRGKTQSCLEIGHIPVIPDGPICGCGLRGCLEAVAGRLAISSAAAACAHRGQAPYLLEHAGTDLQNIHSKMLAEAIAAGDTAVEDIVRRAARHVGQAAAILVNLLLPETVVLGGGLVEAMPDLFRQSVLHTARANVLPSFRKVFQVKAATLGDDAVVYGAAAWARQSQDRG